MEMNGSSRAVRPVASVIPAFRTTEGEGVEIRRALPTRSLEVVGPFIFLDHFGPVDFAPGQAKGAPNHPHRGFETLTYLIEGRGEHRDSLGNHGVVGAGEAQWMRAGFGILHDEGADATTKREGGRVHGMQFWINLPLGRKLSAPAYRLLSRGSMPSLERDGVTVRLVAGRVEGMQGPVETWADPFLAHVALEKGGQVRLDVDEPELAVYLAAGEALVNGRELRAGDMAVFGPGSAVEIGTTAGADAFVLGGPPLDAPIVRHGPFVMNTEDELCQALVDFNLGRFGSIPAVVA